MRMMVEKAIEIIRLHAHNPVPVPKRGYGQMGDEDPNDLATQGDIEAQAHYRETILATPGLNNFGIIGEEGLYLPCTHPTHNLYFTCDPLDGTKAYDRKQTHGVGTMLALVCNSETIAACIGDANNGETYLWVKGGPVIRRRFGVDEELKPGNKTLKKQYILLRERMCKHHPRIADMAEAEGDRQLFKDVEIGGGSIGCHMARLWIGEVGATVLNQKFVTPWDDTPVNAISRALGFVHLDFEPTTGEFTEYEPAILTEVTPRHRTTLIIHRDNLPELKAWLANN
ncbi:MAG: Inositol monophosphatase family [Candidatus Parcubacteria bacterium]|jgi:fructose-1,6-bisphosphatase/inositol monophosphatase family enzyme